MKCEVTVPNIEIFDDVKGIVGTVVSEAGSAFIDLDEEIFGIKTALIGPETVGKEKLLNSNSELEVGTKVLIKKMLMGTDAFIVEELTRG